MLLLNSLEYNISITENDKTRIPKVYLHEKVRRGKTIDLGFLTPTALSPQIPTTIAVLLPN
jgi:hypothetical protein